VCGALSACASKPGEKSDTSEAKAYVDHGYALERRFETTAQRDTWTIGSEPVDITLLLPAQSGSYPLVIYFPGLGESSEAGLAWRHWWAQAGYAVLSAQPSKYGAAVWSSRRARSGEFRDIAQDAFGVTSLASRTQFTRALLDEAWRRQHNAGNSVMSRIDMTRVAIIGYDLGAQTAMMVAGESVIGVEPVPAAENVKCVVALSPYADFSGMGMESNFRSIRLPVLAVTSTQDTDAYGLVTSAAVRRAPFQYMPAGQKYLLLLFEAPHSLLAGAATWSGPARGKYAGPHPIQPDNGMELDPLAAEEAAAETSQPHRNRASGVPPSAVGSVQHARQVAQVQSVTTAFLDEMVKSDPIASEWLSRNAKPWLGESAELQSK